MAKLKNVKEVFKESSAALAAAAEPLIRTYVMHSCTNVEKTLATP